MHSQSTFGAFLVAFTVAHCAPIVSNKPFLTDGVVPADISCGPTTVNWPSCLGLAIAEGAPKPATKRWVDPCPNGVCFTRNPETGELEPSSRPVADKTKTPAETSDKENGISRMIARDPKKAAPKGKSNEMAKAKGAEAGRNAVVGLKNMMDDKLEESDADSEESNKSCNRKKEDKDKEEPSRLAKMLGKDDDDDKSGDEDCEDDEDDEDKKDEPKEDDKEEPKVERRAPPKGGKGGSSGKPGSPDKPQQQGGGSSLGQDIVSGTASNLISDGIWYGVEQATAEDQPVKRSPQKGGRGGSGKPGSSGKPDSSSKPDGGSSLGQDIISGTASNLISDGIWYGVEQATAEDQPAKRSPQKGGKPGSGKPGSSGKPSESQQQDGGSSLAQDIASKTASGVISGGIQYGIEEALAEDAPVEKRSPKGGRFRGAGKDIVSDVVSDGISSGIWYGVDQATQSAKRSPPRGDRRLADEKNLKALAEKGWEINNPAITEALLNRPPTYSPDGWIRPENPVKRDPRFGGIGGAAGRGGGSFLGDLFSWGVEEAVTDDDNNNNVKRSTADTDGRFEQFKEQVQKYVPEDGYKKKEPCAGVPPACGGVDPFFKIEDMPTFTDDLAPIQKRQRKNRGGSRNRDGGSSSSSSGGSQTSSGGKPSSPDGKPTSPGGSQTSSGGSSTPANDGGSSAPPSDANKGKEKDTGSGSDSSSGGWRQGAKDTGKEIVQDVVTDAASGAIVAGIEAALQPQPTEVPVAEQAAPAKRAVEFSA